MEVILPFGDRSLFRLAPRRTARSVKLALFSSIKQRRLWSRSKPWRISALGPILASPFCNGIATGEKLGSKNSGPKKTTAVLQQLQGMLIWRAWRFSSQTRVTMIKKSLPYSMHHRSCKLTKRCCTIIRVIKQDLKRSLKVDHRKNSVAILRDPTPYGARGHS